MLTIDILEVQTQCHKGSVYIQRSTEEGIQGKLKKNPATRLESSRGLVRRLHNNSFIRSNNLKNVKFPNKKESNFVASYENLQRDHVNKPHRISEELKRQSDEIEY